MVPPMLLSRVFVALLSALALLISARASDAAIDGNAWVSLDGKGNQYNLASGAYSYPPSPSDDGALVALESLAPLDFDLDKNGLTDVFVRNTVDFATGLVSANPDGVAGNGRSYGPTMSGDGNFVAFESLASDLVADDTNNAADILLRDRVEGITVRVSGPSGGNADGPSYRAAISHDGGWVAFCSRATNLTEGDANGLADVFLWERATGAITRIEVAGSADSASDGCLRVAVSGDAGVIAFSAVTGGSAGVFVHERATGSTTRLDPEANGPSGTGGMAVSGDGNTVVFDSVADNLIAEDTNRSRDVFAYDRAAATTSRVSVRTSGSQLPGNSGDSGVSVDGDGRYVVFGSTARGVVPGDSNGREDVFRRDLTEGETAIVSINISGQSANNSSYSPAINADGSVVAFTSMAANLVGGDGNRQPDVFIRGTTFPENAGSESGPEDTGAPAEEETAPIVATDDDSSPLLLYGAIAGGVIVLLIAASLLLGRRGRA